MFKFKKTFITISCCLFLSTSTTVLAADINSKYSPTDIKNHWAFNELKDLVDSDILNGYEDNTIKPENTITRAEFVQMLVNAVGTETS